MKPKIIPWIPAGCLLFSLTAGCLHHGGPTSVRQKTKSPAPELAQVPTWSPDDLNFFLHGSMSTEFVPETVLRAFMRTYPEMFPSADFSHLGLIPDPAFGWPVGFSRKTVPHLGGLSSVGVNCASCHVGELTPAGGGANVRVLGMTSHFDAEGFFGAVIVSTFRTADPAGMKQFLAAYLAVNDPRSGDPGQNLFAQQWSQQEEKIKSAMAAEAMKKNADGLRTINGSELRLDAKSLAHREDLAALSVSMLNLFHNMRAALHVPDAPPEKVPPPSGPGRNDAFGLLSAELFGEPPPPAPVKFGLVWNVEQRHWVHWDGNTQSPLGRNLLASLGLGAPLIGRHGDLDFALVQRQTDISEIIRPPRYPFAIDEAAAQRGAAHYQTLCAACHAGAETDARLHSPAEIGTDPTRAAVFTPHQAGLFDKFLAELEIPGYAPPAMPGIRSTQKYWAASLGGVWARSPYLHNGSVRTMEELLTPPAGRPKTFHRGSRVYDPAQMGYTDEGAYLFETTGPGNASTGHDYGATLSAEQKRELIEYLKTL